jgi:hypothetical protein
MADRRPVAALLAGLGTFAGRLSCGAATQGLPVDCMQGLILNPFRQKLPKVANKGSDSEMHRILAAALTRCGGRQARKRSLLINLFSDSMVRCFIASAGARFAILPFTGVASILTARLLSG